MLKLAGIAKDYREAGALCTQVNLFGFVDNEVFLTKSGDLGIVFSIGLSFGNLRHSCTHCGLHLSHSR